MSNLTNGTSIFPSWIGTNGIRFLVEFLSEPRTFLNVPRDEKTIFTLILVAKSILVSCGFIYLLPMPRAFQLLLPILLFSFVRTVGNFIVNLVTIWFVFGAVMVFSTDATSLLPISRIFLSVGALILTPTLYDVPCTVESIIDILFIVLVTLYILDAFLGPFQRITEAYFIEITGIMCFIAVDLFFDAKGCFFTMTFISASFYQLVVDAYTRRKFLSLIVFFLVYYYTVREQVAIYRNQQINMTNKEIETKSN